MTVCHFLPDRHSFRGSYGGKDVLPLYRNQVGTEPNLLTGLLDLLKDAYGKKVIPEDVAGYLYAVLAQPEYTRRFEKELTNRQIQLRLARMYGILAALFLMRSRLL